MKLLITTFLFIISSSIVFGQSIDESFSQEKMKKDLDIFKEIRLKVNSGLYKYRTNEQIDSTYRWAEKEISKANTYIDFYNIICQLTDFEGSSHNETGLPDKYFNSLWKESYGYFPYPIKWIAGKWLFNYKDGEIPLGSEIIDVNGMPIAEVIDNLYKYYHTDGVNITGKRIPIGAYFSKYFRFNYGQQDSFQISYYNKAVASKEKVTLRSVSYSEYLKKFHKRHSKPFDKLYYVDLKGNQKYSYKELNASTGLLSIGSFSMGNQTSKEHQVYAAFLDSVFTNVKRQNLKNLIVDVRLNSGGDDPNDILTYSYLTSRKFQESKQVWISFKKVPLLKHYDSSIPRFLRPFGVGKYNRRFRRRFPTEKDGKYYISKAENEMQVWEPNEIAFTGDIYLLTSPSVNSAGSLFASMVAGNQNTIVIGEETMGGYYGHNGHTPMGYVLPNSKIITELFVENIEQDVPIKANQLSNRGLIPDHNIPQSFEDYVNNKDTQMEFVLKLLAEE